MGSLGKQAVLWAPWLLLAVLITPSALRGDHTVTGEYTKAAERWQQGQVIYSGTGYGFLYLPQTAVLMIPWSRLPTLVYELLWRWGSIALLAWSVYRLAALAGRNRPDSWFPLMSLVVVPLAYSSARNGQMTLLLTATLVLGAVELADQRWWRATLWLGLGLALKPLAIVMVLLAGAVYPPMRERLLVALGVLLAVPFLTQHPDYVVYQYGECVATWGHASEFTLDTYWADVGGLLKNAGLALSQRAETLLRIAAAGGTLGLCLVARRRYRSPEVALLLLTLACFYVLLFNPRTENCTYVLGAPALALFCAEAGLVRRNRAELALWVGLGVGMLGSFEISRLLVPRPQASWLAPLMGCCLVAIVATRILRGTACPETTPPGEDAPRPRTKPPAFARWGRSATPPATGLPAADSARR